MIDVKNNKHFGRQKLLNNQNLYNSVCKTDCYVLASKCIIFIFFSPSKTTLCGLLIMTGSRILKLSHWLLRDSNWFSHTGCCIVGRWFAELCETSSPTEPTKLTLQRRVAPKLLRLIWDGFPLHYDDTHGWGFLVPLLDSEDEDELELQRQEGVEQADSFPFQWVNKFLLQVASFFPILVDEFCSDKNGNMVIIVALYTV